MKKAYLLDIFKFLNENPSPTQNDLLDFYSDLDWKYNLDSDEREYVRNDSAVDRTPFCNRDLELPLKVRLRLEKI